MAFNYDIENVIEVKNLTYTYYPIGHTALKDINLTIKRGEFVALIGQNGSGKTTLIKHFIGLHHPTQGEVLVGGETTEGKPVSDLAHYVGYVFQNPSHQIFADTVREEVEFGPRNLEFSEEEVKASAAEALKAVNLEDFVEESPIVLGRGQLQRLAIASILSMRPKILIIDEPTTGLDWHECVNVLEAVKKLNEDGHTIIMTTHNMNLVSLYAKRAIVLREGEKLLDGPVDEVFEQFEELKSAKVKPPQVYRLLKDFPDIRPDNYRIETVVDALYEKIRGVG